MGGYAWVTLATNDAYSLGALVLAHSLRRVGTKYELAVLVTPGVTEMMREKLAAVFSLVQEVNVLDSKDEANLALLARPELGITFTKLHCWRLTQYEKCVFVDADTLVVRNCDELFEREELSAAPDVGWPDCFNSGVFVFKPSMQTFASITAFAAAKGSFDGGDQGLLNMYFSDWARKDISKHLPFIYNMCSTATYSYLPAYKQFGEDVRIIHFIGITKPWLQYFDTLTGIVQPPAESVHLQPLLQLWWNIFCEKVHPQLSSVMATSTLAPIWHEFTPPPFEPSTPKTTIYTDVNDKIHSDVYSGPPDFTEFKDPWEDYITKSNAQMHPSLRNGETGHCYCTIGRSSLVPSNSTSNSVTTLYETNHELPQQNNNQPYIDKHQNERHYSHPISNGNNQGHFRRFDEESKQHTLVHSQDRESIEHVEEPIHPSRWQDQERVQHPVVHEGDQRLNDNRCHENQHKTEAEYHHEHRFQHVEQQHPHHHTDQHHNHHHQHSTQHHEPHSSQYSDIKKETIQEWQEETDISRRNHAGHQHRLENHLKEQQDAARCEQHIVYHNQEREQSNHEYKSDAAGPIHISFNQVTVKEEHNFEGVSNWQLRHLNDENARATDRQTDAQSSISHPLSEPCTDLHNVAPQSDSNITEHLDKSNAGLAGALAQMTLGEPRSAEQIALEEHMRKQSWEHGQIDYMGRDSFDNIWKKICETLSLAPQRLPSPPKETPKPDEKSSTDDTDTPVKEEVEKEIVQATITPIEEQCLIKDVPTEQIPEQQKPPAEDTISVQEKENIECKIPEEKAQTVGTETVSTDKDIKEAPIATNLEQFSVQKVLEESSQQSEQACTEISAEQVSASPLPEEIAKQSVVLPPSCPIKQSVVISKEQLPLEVVPDSGMAAESIKPPVPSDIVIESSVSAVAQPAITKMEKTEDASTKSDISHPKVDTVTTAPVSAETLVCAEPTLSDEMNKKSDIAGEQHAEILSAASEVLTVSPVPIQVAESVLQAEPQELISDESQVRTQEVLSSTVIPVHEFTATSSETITSAPSQIQLNGTASDVTPMEKIEEIRTIAADIVSSTVPKATETIEKLIELTTAQAETSQPLPILTPSIPRDEEGPKVPTESSAASSGALVDAKKAEESVVVAQAVEEDKCIPESVKSGQTQEAIKDIERPAEEEVKTPLPGVELVQPAEGIKSPEKATGEVKGIKKPVEVVQPPQQPAELAQPSVAAEKPMEQIEEMKIPKEPTKPVEQIKEIESAQKSTELTQQPAEVEHVKEVEQPTADVEKSDATLPSPSTESPIRPIRTKDLNIPGTPIVTEATPPTSPPITTSQELEAQEKATKKTVKKAAEKSMPESDSAEAGEADTGEKKVKKVVKKVVKKPKSKAEDAPDDGADGSSGPSKQKKTVKVVKKGTKPSQTLGAEVPVPETPPPGTSDAPVPPKRKGKATTTKPVAAKKSDLEQ